MNVSSASLTAREPSDDEVTMIPSWQRILLQQLESILGKIGLIAVVALVAVSALIVVLISSDVITGNEGAIGWALMPYFAIAQGVGMVIVLLLPGVTWEGLPPDRRSALHAFPVNRRAHESLRVAAGALIVAVAASVLFGTAFLLQSTLAASALAPSATAFVLAAGSQMIAYLLVSIGGLLTRSATGNLARVLVYGFFLTMVTSLLGQRVAWLSAVTDWVLRHVIAGEWGIGSALLAGSHALKPSTPGVAFPSAVAFWGVTAICLMTLSVGHLPRRGRG